MLVENHQLMTACPTEVPQQTKRVEDFKKYELFPDKKIQDKIDLFFSPYNRTTNLKRGMNFEEEQNEDQDADPGSPEKKWQKISELILNQDGNFLRKSLRVLNKERYDHYAQVSQTMKRIKPRQSFIGRPSMNRMPSFSSAQSGVQKREGFRSPQKIAKSYLQVPGKSPGRSAYKITEELEEVDESDISKIV